MTPPPLQRAPLWRAASLGLWALVLLVSGVDGRLDLLLRAVFHPLVTLAGLLLLLVALLQLRLAFGPGRQERGDRRQARTLLLTAAIALLVLLLPPAPSFADLAGQRPRDETAESELSFVLPPAQRSLTDWVRLLRSQPDPKLFAGDPVRISGFVLPKEGEPPQLARLLVRCCLADASPVGLPVHWPAGQAPFPADQWLAIDGVMGLGPAPGGGERLEVVPSRIRPIPRPARPLEP
ncbi:MULTISPECIES: TIGR03943 family putative permease subunit [unclassified Cyanobium]|uniref:TIGR03943 family putative permease subunit n=1 Tax=unclassified Cyanobium TaxID=2627006 RepID=UPI0020CE196B|nr:MULTISPECIES: TIGR03943 family protein [unclassified Cyanobium]MCP9835837.1 TIGR03943 family protein [Cyanobium sp. La Preciosa 7G6]MCP9935798.1 TIGR03943 family protein [Cyanobium sp. Aljojuca 7A6]